MTYEEARQIQADYTYRPAGSLSRKEHARWMESIMLYGNIPQVTLMEDCC